MCFSAEASFTASAVLGGCGVFAIRNSQTSSQKVFASIPLIFAAQQFTEGWLWVGLAQPDNPEWTEFATQLFLFFAWVIWPFLIPLSARLLESKPSRKKWLTLLLAGGSIVSSLLAYALLLHPVDAVIREHHISYSMALDFEYQWLVGVLYFIPVSLSLFLSSLDRMWVVGLMVLLSFAISILFYRQYLISVWCFFAAITSVSILWVLYRMNGKRSLQPDTFT